MVNRQRWFVTSWRRRSRTLHSAVDRVRVDAEHTAERAVAEVVQDGVFARVLADRAADAFTAARDRTGMAASFAALPPNASPPVWRGHDDEAQDRSARAVLDSVRQLVDNQCAEPMRLALTTVDVAVVYHDNRSVTRHDQRIYYTLRATALDPRRQWLTADVAGTDPSLLGAQLSADLRWKSRATPGERPAAVSSVILRRNASRALLTFTLAHRLSARLQWLHDRPAVINSTRSRSFDDAGFTTPEVCFRDLAASPPIPGRVRLADGAVQPLLCTLEPDDSARQELSDTAVVCDSVTPLNDAGADGLVALLAAPCWLIHADSYTPRRLAEPLLMMGSLDTVSLAPLAGPLVESADEPNLLLTSLFPSDSSGGVPCA